MSDTPYLRKRDFHGAVSGEYRVLASSTGLIPLVPTIPQHTIFIQTIHIEVTTPTAAELWTFQDGAGIAIVPNVSAAAVAHFDFDFGPDGVPCSVGSRFDLKITGAVGAVGWITWEGYKQFTLGASYAQAVLDDAPSGYWRLGEASGPAAIDSAPTPHNGLYVGGVTLRQPGAVGDGNTAAAFDGSGSVASVSGVPYPVAGFSLEAWVKIASAVTAFIVVNLGEYAVLGLTSGVPYFAIWDTSYKSVVDVPYVLSFGVWHHLVGTYAQDGFVKLYVDGVFKNQAAVGTHGGAAVSNAYLGAKQDFTGALIGSMDEAAIYPVVLTPAQIVTHYRIALAA